MSGSRRALLPLLIAAALAGPAATARQTQAPPSFAGQIAALSEPAGYFDTDNLISNERSYLQVLSELGRRKVSGGAYIGVGPDQNFSYIAAIRPSIAYIVDIRRDNLLLHLLFKALFAQSPTRIEYLAQLTGRPNPPNVDGWRAAPIDRLVDYIDRASPLDGAALAALRQRLDAGVARTGVPLSADDRATIDRFHRRFVADGLSLRFQSTGRPPQDYNPTFRDLLRDRDDGGRQSNYLASDEAFQFLKGLQSNDRIVPVTGDLSGPTALAAIGKAIAARQERLSAFYVSNVEFYLFSAGSYPRFAANLARLPRAPNGVVIRSIFGRFAWPSRPGDASASRLQDVDELLREYAAGRIRQYGDIAGR